MLKMENDTEKYRKSLEEFTNELDSMESALRASINDVLKLNDPDLNLRAYRAEWHVKGLIYHCRNIIENYAIFSEEVIIRATADEYKRPDGLIMHSEAIQKMMFEFYALVNLCKISLDNLSKLVYSLFTNKHMPKSITKFTSGTTNCPIYERLANDSITDYLVDLRNCLVHYRTFATNDNVYVIKEGLKEDSIMDMTNSWISPMAKATFRYTEDNKIVVNTYLPDKIFQRNENGESKLANFTYENKFNLLGYSMRFTRTVMFSTMEGFSYLKKGLSGAFTYNKHGFKKKVAYIDFRS